MTTDTENSPLTHWQELRKRVLFCVSAYVMVMIPCCFYAQYLFDLIATPLLNRLPEASQLVATHLTATFWVPFKCALAISFLLTLPFISYQIWAYLAPALYRREKKLLRPIIIIIPSLFYLGMAFAYLVVLPLMFNFFIHVTPGNVAIMADIGAYFELFSSLMISFGLCFETPMIIFLLCAFGVIHPQTLAKARRYVIVAAFTIGMLLTPPDVISQTLLALPLWLLFECGIFMANHWEARRADKPAR